MQNPSPITTTAEASLIIEGWKPKEDRTKKFRQDWYLLVLEKIENGLPPETQRPLAIEAALQQLPPIEETATVVELSPKQQACLYLLMTWIESDPDREETPAKEWRQLKQLKEAIFDNLATPPYRRGISGRIRRLDGYLRERSREILKRVAELEPFSDLPWKDKIKTAAGRARLLFLAQMVNEARNLPQQILALTSFAIVERYIQHYNRQTDGKLSQADELRLAAILSPFAIRASYRLKRISRFMPPSWLEKTAPWRNKINDFVIRISQVQENLQIPPGDSILNRFLVARAKPPTQSQEKWREEHRRDFVLEAAIKQALKDPHQLVLQAAKKRALSQPNLSNRRIEEILQATDLDSLRQCGIEIDPKEYRTILAQEAAQQVLERLLLPEEVDALLWERAKQNEKTLMRALLRTIQEKVMEEYPERKSLEAALNSDAKAETVRISSLLKAEDLINDHREIKHLQREFESTARIIGTTQSGDPRTLERLKNNLGILHEQIARRKEKFLIKAYFVARRDWFLRIYDGNWTSYEERIINLWKPGETITIQSLAQALDIHPLLLEDLIRRHYLQGQASREEIEEYLQNLRAPTDFLFGDKGLFMYLLINTSENYASKISNH